VLNAANHKTTFDHVKSREAIRAAVRPTFWRLSGEGDQARGAAPRLAFVRSSRLLDGPRACGALGMLAWAPCPTMGIWCGGVASGGSRLPG